MFGAFNAFASGIAILGVIAAILLQREQNQMQAEELRLQRIELEQTREELKRNFLGARPITSRFPRPKPKAIILFANPSGPLTSLS